MTGHESELSKDTYLDVIQKNGPLFAEAARCGLDAPVPTCPGWSVAILVAHLGRVQRFWAHQIKMRAQEPQDLPLSVYDSCPGLLEWSNAAEGGNADMDAIPPGLIEWFETGSEELVTTFREVEPDDIVWHWSGDDRAITHMRNQAMEVTVHRWDAQNSHGATTPIDSVLIVDGINQHFEVQIPAARKWGKPASGTGETYHFHQTDGEGEWLVLFEGDDVTVRHEHAKGDIAVRGLGEDLFLWLWGRAGAERLEIHGDTSLLDRYRQLVSGS